jgi:hypothetical protein
LKGETERRRVGGRITGGAMSRSLRGIISRPVEEEGDRDTMAEAAASIQPGR